jgi:putative endopeptidase
MRNGTSVKAGALVSRVLALALMFATVPALAAGPAVPPWGVDLSYVDKTVKPGDDFFAYANAGWLGKAEIPADRSYAGVNLELDLQNEARLKGLVAGLAGKASPTDEERKLRDLYAAFLDTAAIEAAGLAPAKADLERISKLKTPDEIAAAMGAIELQLDGPFGLYIGVDDKHPESYSVNLYQSGLGLPDRDYYLRDDKEIAAARDAYKKYLAQMLGFAGIENAEARAAAVYKLEEDIAKASWPSEERRDADKTYNPMPISELEKLAPRFPWKAMLAEAGIAPDARGPERKVIVAEKSAFPGLAEIFAATPVAVWRDYLAVRYLHAYSDFLPKAIDDADFAFYGTVLQGKTQQLDRRTRALMLLDYRLGEALGKLYVAEYFPPEAKAKAMTLVQNLLTAYERDIRTLSWMTPKTRAKALEKLHRYALKIGYPDKWRDYSALAIDRGDLVGDIKRSNRYEWNRQIKRLDAPVDRSEWGMTPQTNNAYYNPAMNEIAFPAGILQPPFFDPDADDAVNYGEIGATIGHEISHGFDDQGSKYDGAGVLGDWWTGEDRKNFDARTKALAGQYDAYEPLPGLHINGRLTLGENIADLAGLVIALKAYHLSLNGKPAPVLNGLTGDQRFYIAYAQSWREKWRDGRLRESLLSNPHSPSAYRVNGVVRNDDGWYEAFDIKPGDKNYLPPDQRVKLW